MKKLLTAILLSGVVGLSAGMLVQPVMSADDAEGAAATAGGSDNSGGAKADDGDASSMGAEPAGEEPAQGDAPPDDKAAADPDGAKE